MNKYLAGLLLAGLMASDKKYENHYTNTYWWGHVELLNRGASEDVVSKMDGELARRIALYFDDKHAPGRWVRELSLEAGENTYKKIKKDRYYRKTKKELEDGIEKRIFNGKHFYRKDEEYNENSYDVGNINDKAVLSIVNKYCDFFENPKTGEEIKKMFPNGEDSYEYLGIIRDEGRKFKLFPIDTRWESKLYAPDLRENKRNSIPPPSLIPYINHIGIIHSHPVGNNEEIKLSSGPSLNDIYLLIEDNKINPYQVNAVVTYLNEKEYNADIYFRNVVRENNVASNNSDVIVYDLGVFKFER